MGDILTIGRLLLSLATVSRGMIFTRIGGKRSMSAKALLLMLGVILPVQASTYTGSVSAVPLGPGTPDSCSQSSSVAVTCSAAASSALGAVGNGQAFSGISTSVVEAGIPYFTAEVNGVAATHNFLQSQVLVIADASFDLDITILGAPAGTLGYVAFETARLPPEFGGAKLGYPSQFNTPTPGCPFQLGPCGSFTYGTPFEVTADVDFGITEAEVHGFAAIGNFTIYDQNFNVLAAGASLNPNGTILVTPEPETGMLLLVTLAG